MEKGTLRKADMITSIILMIISISGFFMSLQLLLKTLSRGKDWFESAGLFPMIVTFFLGMCAVSLFRTARKDGAKFDFLTMEKAAALIKSKEFKVASIVIGTLAAYIIVLMLPGKLYVIATFIYLLTSMLMFQKRTKKAIINSIIISVVATAVLAFGFGQLAMIPLP